MYRAVRLRQKVMAIDSVTLAKTLESTYGQLSGESLLAPVIKNAFPRKLCLVSSFGAEAALLLDMVAKIDPSLPVIFLDTQKLFPETLAYRDTLIQHLGMKNVRTIYPDYADTARLDPDGILNTVDTNSCCYIRKVKPLHRALKGFDAWITGRKRYQGGLRTELPTFEAFEGRVKINPLAAWSRSDIENAIKARGLPEHPLKEQGYLSIGCLPCTDLPASAEDIRSGRWKDSGKIECGIHLKHRQIVLTKTPSDNV